MQSPEYARMFEQEDHYWWFVARRRLALRLLAKFVPKGSTLLDVGCGTGAGLSAFSDDYVTYGADFSDLAIEFCHERGIRRILRANGEQLPIATNSLDAVISLDTVEHIPNDQAAIEEITRILKPGGIFIINVPAFRWLWGPHDIALMHQRRYTRREVCDILGAAGLEIELATYSVFFLFPVVLLTRLLAKFRPAQHGAELPKVSEGLNRLLIRLQRFEASLAIKFSLPWGSSVVAVARKPD